MSIEDLLFKDFIENDNESALEKLVELVDSWLFAIVYTFVCDEDNSDDIIKSVWKQVIRDKYKIYERNNSIIYEIFLIAKNLLFEIK